jgi:hypothetical protein
MIYLPHRRKSFRGAADTGNDAYTKLLLHMDGTDDAQLFGDVAQGNGITPGILGVSAGYFDGTGDYLTIPDSADWDFGSDDFTIDLWINTVDEPGVFGTLIDRWDSSANKRAFSLELTSSYKIGFYYTYDGGSGAVESISSDSAVNDGVWHHVAIVRDGDNDLTMYIDGVAQADSDNLAANSLYATNIELGIGIVAVDHLYPYTGYMDEVRISKGVARWTSGFTPSTSNYTSDANTKLLLHMDGGAGSVAFTDSGNTTHTVTANGDAVQVTGHVVTANGNAKTENTQKKFGVTSGYFNGTGDYLTIPDSVDWTFGTDPFTIDMWIYANTITSTDVLVSTYTNTPGEFEIFHNSANKIKCGFHYASAIDYFVEQPDTYSINTWTHVAVVRENTTTIKLYIGGVLKDTETVPADMVVNAPAAGLRVGSLDAGGISWPYTGYIDELRISKGIARWISNFSVPTVAYY